MRQLETLEREQHARGSRLLWFRGHADADWELRPTLQRFIRDVGQEMEAAGIKIHEPDRCRLFWEYCKSFYSRYRNAAWSLLSTAEQQDPWAVLFSMRHYGLPTQVLDWTRSFAYAMYFALENAVRDAAVYILSPERLNSAVAGIDGIITPYDANAVVDVTAFHPHWAGDPKDRPDTTIAISPNLSNVRMVAQQAAFTVSGYSTVPLEQQHGPDVIGKIVIPSEAFADARRYLEHAGVRHFTLFPDLTGIAKDILEEIRKEQDCVRMMVHSGASRG